MAEMSAQERAAIIRDDISRAMSVSIVGSTIIYNAIVAAIEQAERAADKRQMEKDCAAVCPECAKGYTDIRQVGPRIFAHADKTWKYCQAVGIREAWKAAHAAPEPATQGGNDGY